MPRAAAATLVAVAGPNGSLPANDALGAPVRVAHPSPNTWSMVTTTTTPSVLRLRLSDVPGWQATVDGKPVGLRRFAGVMLELRVPAGRHHVEAPILADHLHHRNRPGAACSVIGLATILILSRIRSRRLGQRGELGEKESGAVQTQLWPWLTSRWILDEALGLGSGRVKRPER